MSDVSLSSPFGLTRDGFIRQRLADIQQNIASDLSTRLGLMFDTSPDSLTGQFIAVFAEREAILWEQLELVHLSMYPGSAEGDALDDAVSFSGVTRLPAQRGETIGELFGAEGVIINAGAEASLNTDTRKVFLLFTSVTISRNNASDVQYLVVNNSPSLEIDNILYSASGGMASPTAAAVSLATAINTNVRLFAFAAGASIRIRTVAVEPANFAQESGLIIQSLGCPGLFRSRDFDSFGIPENTLTVIRTSVIGWNGVSNRLPGTPGQERESDAALRRRYTQGVFRLGAAVPSALRANLEQVPGVKRVRVVENDTNSTDAEGRPAHSFEAIVEGGVDVQIAKVVYNNKPAGIASYGTTTISYEDSNGLLSLIKFTRPVAQVIWIKYTIVNTTEEIRPIDYQARVARAMVEFGKILTPGDNVYMGRLAAVASGIPGIARITVTAGVGTLTTPPGAYSSSDISISLRQYALITEARISEL